MRTALDRAEAGRGGTLFLTAPMGAGKTRLAQAIREEAERRGFLVCAGCAYPLESRLSYSIFCELLDPVVRAESPEVLLAWTRGRQEFGLLCPSLATTVSPGASYVTRDHAADIRNRLLWNAPGFLDRLRRGRPLLLVMEDLEWADPSSLELLHFLGRRSSEHGFLIVGTFASEEAGARGDAAELARALESRSEAVILELGPLGPEDVRDAIHRAFDVAPEVVRGFSRSLCRWTGGNPLFVRSVLESLVSSGHLREEGTRWVGWSWNEPALPKSIHHLVRKQLESLTEPARMVVELAAVAGTRIHFGLLREAVGMEPAALFAVLQELEEKNVLEETGSDQGVIYSFVHPVVRDILYGDLGRPRSRRLHAELARTLEGIYGDDAMQHAGELAAHLVHCVGGADVVDGERGASYMASAGRDALATYGNRQAARYLKAALDLLPRSGLGRGQPTVRYDLLIDLARARHRLGDLAGAEELLFQAREVAAEISTHAGMARVDRRLGLAMLWAGRLDAALAHRQSGLDEAKAADDPTLEARLHLGMSASLQEAGQPASASRHAEEALRIGEEEGVGDVRFAAHRTLALLHTWTGPPETARDHGGRALTLAKAVGGETALFSAHRTLAVLEGLTGHPADARHHLDAAGGIAERLGSPLLELELADVRIEYCAGMGHWDRGMDLAEESIRMARELSQYTILTRLLVWSGLLHLDRGDLAIARVQLTEAWELAGAGPVASHTAILAHVGRTALHLASGDYTQAIRVGEKGLDLVERSGNRIWAIHRLLPIMAEAALHGRDLDRARRIAARLRRESEAFGHPVGLVWADTCDALVTWLAGDVPRGAREMAAAAERLEAIGTVPYAARLRRQLAGRLAELGERDAAIRELRRVHDILAELGAEPELDKTRGQFREVGARPPSRNTGSGAGLLTPREKEIARLVGERKSNKAIGKELGISHRTVGTHVSNIFRKLKLPNRSRLGDLVRTGLLDDGA